MRSEERESWRRADALLAELVDLPVAERRAAAAQAIAAAGDPTLAERVMALLDALEREAGPLDVPLALALGEEPQRWLDGRPALATPDSLLDRLGKGVRRLKEP